LATQAQSISLETLRPFPPAACKLIRLINNEKVDFRDVSNVIAADAAFSSQVLRLANSALIGGRYEIASVLQALSVVGVDRLRDLVVTVALKNFMGDTDNACLLRCWRHNLATAFWCEKLAARFDIEIPSAIPREYCTTSGVSPCSCFCLTTTPHFWTRRSLPNRTH
jgi:HD-like signal output (HDOD) protein